MLSKGPGYCFLNTPSRKFYHETLQDFIRKLQWSVVYKKNFNASINRFGIKKSSKWVNKSLVNKNLDVLCKRIYNSSLQILSSNKVSAEKFDYQKDGSIHISVADKGSNWVIQSKSSYNNEALSQLNTNFYEKIERPKNKQNFRAINHLINYLYLKKFINLREKRFLLVDKNFKTRCFYLLPKIHKNVWTVPNFQPKGRPIISCLNSESHQIGIFIDFFLQPLVCNSNSYVRDTYHFISKLQNLSVSNKSILVTADITSLYTNIPVNDAIDAIKILFNRYPDSSRPDAVIVKLISIILFNNDFTFNNEFYVQKKGVAMGQRFAPSIANIYLILWEEHLKTRFKNFPNIWLRYIDDIFFVWNEPIQDLNTFLNDVNCFDPNIKITHTLSSVELTYLDITIFKSDDSLKYKIYFKDTNSHSILHTSSHHPKHIFKGVIYSQLRRWASLCSEKSDFDNACTNIFPIWIERGYTRTLLRNTKKKVLTDLNLLTTWEHSFSHCNTCNFKEYLYTCNTFSVNKISYCIIGNYSCLSTNVIYLIYCNSCDIYYVGQTINFHDRLYKHIEAIKNHCNLHVHSHFWKSCTLKSFKIFIIDSAKTVNKLKIKESNYIKKFKTRFPKGFNATENYSSSLTLALPFNKTSFKICNNIKSICTANNINIRTVYKQGKSLKQALK